LVGCARKTVDLGPEESINGARQRGLTLNHHVCVVIPAFRVSRQILRLLSEIGPEVRSIIVVDDKCPESSGELVLSDCHDPRVQVLFHQENKGVGGAVKTGYLRALEIGADIIVKLDGDGQMDPKILPRLIEPLIQGYADYSKGNRFTEVDFVRSMPKKRILGNLVLSFMSKLSTGYWRTFDPNNGYTAITSRALHKIPLSKIDNRYFFESDMLFRLNIVRVNVIDVPMPAIYENEVSSLKIWKVVLEFPVKHLRNFLKRVAYSYYLRDFTLPSIELPLGLSLLTFGGTLGLKTWFDSSLTGTFTSAGTAMLIGMTFLAGLQLILAFFSYDISNTPSWGNRDSMNLEVKDETI
jgi:dolichol-phosphate mannosyltransferase